jgi:hypothetical protein
MLSLLLFMAFTYYKTVTIDHTQCGIVDSTDFPVAIWVTDADLKTVANGGKVQNSSGYDIRPYSDSGLTIALTYELVASTYVATTGAVEMHVKIPTVSASSDTLFYLAFGDSGISTDGSSTATWSNGYTLVAHFANGSSLSLADSSGNGYTGTNNSATATAGTLDGGSAVTGGTDVTFPAAPVDTVIAGDFTASVWCNPTSLGAYSAIFDAYAGSVAAAKYLAAYVNGGVLAYAGVGTLEGPIGGTVTYTTGTWHQMVWTRTNSQLLTIFYTDGGLDVNVGSGLPGTTTGSGPLHVGTANPLSGGVNWDGAYDEVRLATIARSADWVTAEYNNQKPSSTFLTYGALTPVGGSNDNFDWLQRRAVPLPNWRPTWITVP